MVVQQWLWKAHVSAGPFGAQWWISPWTFVCGICRVMEVGGGRQVRETGEVRSLPRHWDTKEDAFLLRGQSLCKSISWKKLQLDCLESWVCVSSAWGRGGGGWFQPGNIWGWKRLSSSVDSTVKEHFCYTGIISLGKEGVIFPLGT